MPCPFDLRLRIEGLDGDVPRLVNVLGRLSPVSASNLRSLVVLMPRDSWRHPDRPVLQVAAPWRFLADEPVWMTQMPAFGHYHQPALPGLLIAGRFPFHIWPRILMWAFEWHNPSQEIVLRRGEPWFYVNFATNDPSRRIHIVEARMTDELREYCRGIDGVAGFVRGTQSLFKRTGSRRRARLLTKKE